MFKIVDLVINLNQPLRFLIFGGFNSLSMNLVWMYSPLYITSFEFLMAFNLLSYASKSFGALIISLSSSYFFVTNVFLLLIMPSAGNTFNPDGLIVPGG